MKFLLSLILLANLTLHATMSTQLNPRERYRIQLSATNLVVINRLSNHEISKYTITEPSTAFHSASFSGYNRIRVVIRQLINGHQVLNEYTFAINPSVPFDQ